jgi:hypothetical protein
MTASSNKFLSISNFVISLDSSEAFNDSIKSITQSASFKAKKDAGIKKVLKCLVNEHFEILMSLFFIPSGTQTLSQVFLDPSTAPSSTFSLLELVEKMESYRLKTVCEYDLYTFSILLTDMSDAEFKNILDLRFNQEKVKYRFKKEIVLFKRYLRPQHVSRLFQAMTNRVENSVLEVAWQNMDQKNCKLFELWLPNVFWDTADNKKSDPYPLKVSSLIQLEFLTSVLDNQGLLLNLEGEVWDPSIPNKLISCLVSCEYDYKLSVAEFEPTREKQDVIFLHLMRYMMSKPNQEMSWLNPPRRKILGRFYLHATEKTQIEFLQIVFGSLRTTVSKKKLVREMLSWMSFDDGIFKGHLVFLEYIMEKLPVLFNLCHRDLIVDFIYYCTERPLSCQKASNLNEKDRKTLIRLIFDPKLIYNLPYILILVEDGRSIIGMFSVQHEVLNYWRSKTQIKFTFNFPGRFLPKNVQLAISEEICEAIEKNSDILPEVYFHIRPELKQRFLKGLRISINEYLNTSKFHWSRVASLLSMYGLIDDFHLYANRLRSDSDNLAHFLSEIISESGNSENRLIKHREVYDVLLESLAFFDDQVKKSSEISLDKLFVYLVRYSTNRATVMLLVQVHAQFFRDCGFKFYRLDFEQAVMDRSFDCMKKLAETDKFYRCDLSYHWENIPVEIQNIGYKKATEFLSWNDFPLITNLPDDPMFLNMALRCFRKKPVVRFK